MTVNRRGVELSLEYLIILILVVFLTSTSHGFVGQMMKAMNRGFSEMDEMRMKKSVEMMIGEGTATADLTFNTQYPEVEVAQGRIVLRADFLENGERVIRLPERFEYAGPSTGTVLADVDDICIMKQGKDIQFGHPPCPRLTCQEGTCQNIRYGPYDAPRYGYRCNSGVSKRDQYYQHYGDSNRCSIATGNFLHLNSFQCPMQVLPGEQFQCLVKTTFNCPQGGSVQVELRTADVTGDVENVGTRTLSCETDTVHRRVPFDLNIEGDIRAMLRIQAPGSQESMMRSISVRE